MSYFGQTEPHRNCRQNAGFVRALITLLQGKSVNPFLGRPESLVERRLLMIKLSREHFADIVFSNQPSQIGKRVQSLDAEPRLIELILYRQKRTTLHPTVSDSRILRETLRVIS